MIPSPMARTLRPDPALWGERVAHRQARRANHPSVYDQERDTDTPTVLLAMSPVEAALIVTALTSNSAAAAQELGIRLRAQLQAHTVHVTGDDTPPYGMPR